MRAMKDSGIEWIKEIPESWSVRRGKNILELQKRDPSKYGPDEVITCFRDGEVTLRKNRREEGFTFSDKEIGYQGILEGDLVIHGMDGFAGAIGISDSNGKASPVLVVCDSKESKRFLMYYLRMLATQNVFIALATGIRERSCDLRWNKVADLLFPIPEKAEQMHIVEYLDAKCSQIDNVIEKQEQIIEKIKEYKIQVITSAVTKGIKPEVELKKSGNDIIGDIPKHWEIRALKYLYDNSRGSAVRVGPFGSAMSGSDIVDSGVWVYNQRTILDMNFKNNDTFVTEEKAKELSAFSVEPGDILVTTRGTIGKTAIVPENAPKGILHPCVIRFRIDDKKYCNQLLQNVFNYTELVQRQILDMSNSTTIEVLYSYSLKEIRIPVPPVEEQYRILKWIEQKINVIDNELNRRKALVEKLREYKKSLIYEVITGKKEV